jgi:hypothetical protein
MAGRISRDGRPTARRSITSPIATASAASGRARLDPLTKPPIAEPSAIHHFHQSRLSPMNVGLGFLEIAVAKDKIVMNLGELKGNIWSLNQR